MMIFCTLFDSNYLDKGILLYRSLKDTCSEFKLYVLAMDDQCKKVLEDYNYHDVHVIHLDGFIHSFHLGEVYKTRSRGEFCWTCTAFLVGYVLDYCKENICTYIDADMYFYSDPQCLIDEMDNKTVQIVEHRFDSSINGKVAELDSGKYCVQFNTFKNTKDSIELLHWWQECCFNSCTKMTGEDAIFGDQGYLEKWGELSNVSILKNLGGGVAPWNINQYKIQSNENGIVLREKRTGKDFRLVFYHFHLIKYLDNESVDINVYEPWKADQRLVSVLYGDYLHRIQDVRIELKKQYGIDFFSPQYSKKAITEQEDQRKKTALASRLKKMNMQDWFRLYDRRIGQRKRKFFSYLNIFRFADNDH